MLCVHGLDPSADRERAIAVLCRSPEHGRVLAAPVAVRFDCAFDFNHDRAIIIGFVASASSLTRAASREGGV